MPPARGRLLPGAEQRIAADLGGGKPLWNRLDRTRPVAARDIANKKAAQIGAAFLLCLKGGYRVASRAVSFASPTALWAAPFANLLCLLAVAILRWACPGGWWNSALAAAQHVADDDAGG
jgi:hypothetical protein